MHRPTRRQLLGGLVLGAAGLGLLDGCTPAAPGASSSAAPSTLPASGSVASAKTARSVNEIAAYRGADRQQVLVEGARKEGSIMWYTSLIVDQAVRPLSAAFQAKYPFLTVENYRANSSEVVQRVSAEYQAKHYAVGLVDGTSSVPALKAAGLLIPFYSPEADAFPSDLKDAQGQWVALKIAFSTLGYNTKLVSAAEVPKTYDDLLDPKWKGKMGWSTSAGSGAPDFVGNQLMVRGQEASMDYLRKLATQDIRNYNLAVRAVLDQVIAGEVPLGVHISNHHAIISKGQGAPIDWVPLEPVPVVLQSVALPSNTPAPHASMLLIDFILSEEGQKILRDRDYIPSRPNVEGVDAGLRMGERFKVNVFKPEEAQAKEKEWVALFNQVFGK
jgi:ABC-type Fe3+ transport system substrate-binding protein